MNASRRDVRFTPESGHTLGQLRQCVRVMRESVAVCSLAQRPPSSGLSPFPFVPAHGHRHRSGIVVGSFPAYTRADISVKIRRSTKLWHEVTRPGRCCRAEKAA
jgi:hypothetical protein